MEIGYACIALAVHGSKISACMQKSASEENLRRLINCNLDALGRIFDYNRENGIKLFRICSDIIPFGSSPVNTLDWRKEFKDKLLALGKKAGNLGIRLSMHPGQYTVLSSPNNDVLSRSIEDLRYHCGFLDSLGVGREGKIIVHAGGIYGDKKSAMERFTKSCNDLCSSVRARLVIENDDICYNIYDVLELSHKTGLPVVFDALHNSVNPTEKLTAKEALRECAKIWGISDGKMKIHYSQQEAGKKAGTHSYDTKVSEFLRFVKDIGQDCDIMLEVKNKNISAIKCINCIKGNNSDLLIDINRYRFSVCERNPAIFSDLIKRAPYESAEKIYGIIEEVLRLPPQREYMIEAATQAAMQAEKTSCLSPKTQGLLKKFRENNISYSCIKNNIFNTAVHNNMETVYNSYYFIDN